MSAWIHDTMLSGSMVAALPVAVVAGLVSFFSPCTLPLLPGYLSYVSGVAPQDLGTAGRPRLLLGTVLFVLGFSVVFISAGTFFGSLGDSLYEHRQRLAVLGGVVVIVMGVGYLGFIPVMQRSLRVRTLPGVGVAVAPVLGIAFGFAWTPCIGPTLAAIMTLAITDTDASALRGGTLAAAYCLGLGIPFAAAALGLQRFFGATTWLRRHQRALAMAGGGMLITVGTLLVTGEWQSLVDQLRSWAATLPAFAPSL